MIRQLLPRYMRKRERGQAVVVLAFGFVALLMFVGIVTDISLMFVRYTTLRRAVDSAAIAAAGQMRRDRNMANVQLAARQFIEFHGIAPDTVLVETCQTEQAAAAAESRPVDADLCTNEQRKLVRVTAQVRSPTVFLQLFGWTDIVLEASAYSETAVLDVVIVMDVSESMLESTTYDQWANIGMGRAYVPPTVWDYARNVNGGTDPTGNQWLFTWNAMTVDASLYGDPLDRPGSGSVPGDTSYQTNLNPLLIEYNYGAAVTLEPRTECTVRFWSNSINVPVPDGSGFNLLNQYATNAPATDWARRRRPFPDFYDGFVPTYNFYGCCNDPGNGTVDANGNVTGISSAARDNDFSDLICQPFKEARDATRLFLNTIDFERGDRVAFVTFDQQAFLIDPDGTNGGFTHMIGGAVGGVQAREMATTTLNRYVGVRSEPAFYHWNETTGGWDSFIAPSSTNADLRVSADFREAPNNYPVANDCVFINAALPFPYSPYTSVSNMTPIFNRAVPGATPLRWARTPGDPNLADRDGNPVLTTQNYEFRGACRGTNVGAALREASNALLMPETTRSANTVWVIVLLGDGAAGASDPVVRNGQPQTTANPYLNSGNNPVPADYGAYGVCPTTSGAELFDPDGFPYCSDEDVQTRHFCSFRSAPCDGNVNDLNCGYPVVGFPDDTSDIDLGAPGCSADYDVDDYARDWADYVGLESENGADALLPTVFTIGFGLDFSQGSGTCGENVADCLGEELLRYVADVGDNFRIDTDYQQAWLFLRDGQPIGDYGPRGICEDPNAPAGTYAPIAPTENCGNYFNAPDQTELNVVFNEIASRMFTRIAR